jgi:hypothetical protein
MSVDDVLTGERRAALRDDLLSHQFYDAVSVTCFVTGERVVPSFPPSGSDSSEHGCVHGDGSELSLVAELMLELVQYWIIKYGIGVRSTILLPVSRTVLDPSSSMVHPSGTSIVKRGVVTDSAIAAWNKKT